MLENTKKIENIVTKQIQAMGLEGGQSEIMIESLLSGSALSGTDGTTNDYTSYSKQVTDTYRKYNGKEQLGNEHVRGLIDIRSAFIAGEGISISGESEKHLKFMNDLLQRSKYKGSRFINLVRSLEMEGKSILFLKADKEDKLRIIKKNTKNKHFKVILEDEDDIDSIKDVVSASKEGKEGASLGLSNFVYIKTGGDPNEINETTTRIGICLNTIDNYDRGRNAMRTNNHLFGKITPYFETQDAGAASSILKTIEKVGWKIGSAFAGPAKMHLITPNLGAMDNIKQELFTHTKQIAMVTGIPVHWIGWVDAMHNRSTAEALYETIVNATILERTTIAEAFKELLIKAQEMAVDSGNKEIDGIFDDFEVKIPIVSFSKMLEYVKALSLAFNDQVISKADYQNLLPGIDPFFTNKMLMKEQDQDVATSVKTLNLPLPEDGDEEKGDIDENKE